jgi:EAL domain-containing protein (putative c-di-GMP-specific phosphodiesterase class I)
LHMKVIAEGVETLEQVSYLMHHGCKLLQGYYFSRPVPVREVQGLLEKDYSSAYESVNNN